MNICFSSTSFLDASQCHLMRGEVLIVYVRKDRHGFLSQPPNDWDMSRFIFEIGEGCIYGALG